MNVYFFTRTGRCEVIANAIAKAHGVTAQKIDDGRDWSGKLNFVKAGAAAAKKESIKPTYTPPIDGELILVYPIWAGTFPPGVRGFIDEVGAGRITAVSVSAATSLGEGERKPFAEFYEVKGKITEPPRELLSRGNDVG